MYTTLDYNTVKFEHHERIEQAANQRRRASVLRVAKPARNWWHGLRTNGPGFRFPGWRVVRPFAY